MSASCELTVSGMRCQNCGLLIDDVLEEMSGVVRARTEVRRGSTRVEYDPDLVDLDTIAAAIAEVGYTAVPTA